MKPLIFLSANHIMHLKFAWQFAWLAAIRRSMVADCGTFAIGWMICRCWGDPVSMSLVVESCMLVRFVWGFVNPFVWAQVCGYSKVCPSLHSLGKLPVLCSVEDADIQTQPGCKYVALLLFVLVKYILHVNPVIRQLLFKYSRMLFICFLFEFNIFFSQKWNNKQLLT